MEIKVYKTYEVPDELWEPIAQGFRESFETTTSTDIIKLLSTRNKLGYGYHAVALTEEGEVAGYNAFSPTFYENNLKVVVSGSTYVKKEYRKEAFLFMNMMQALRKAVVADGFKVEVGVPNHNSRKFAAKVLGLKYVGDLDYYMLPLHVSKCLKKQKLSFLNPLSSVVFKCHMLLQSGMSFFFNTKEKTVKYRLEQNTESRNARFNKSYKHIIGNSSEAFYRVFYEDGIKTVYLMDFCENNIRTNKSLTFAIGQIIKQENPDAILFVGTLRMSQLSLFKVPHKFIPKPLPLTYYVLNKEDKTIFEDMDDMNNWNFSLMNFDVR